MSTPQTPELTRRESVVVDATPAEVYDLVTSIERTGEWSPVCTSCAWEPPHDGPRVGAWFTGRNEKGTRVWETRSQVVEAEPGRSFAWLVGGAFVRWGYELAPLDDGRTELTETWEFLPEGLAMFRDKYGDDADAQVADAQVADRASDAHAGIPATLATLKRILES
ncbi:SRPBCC family protein [Nocardioides sp. CFH 31398]|uniref:SRPBCC family protein n=1 Tax=Nocardioides sp. CFH 31398 TaxID=2919579 RepID=UPI001F063050|nr:SRPBCC family protein [Nocardioides sp. CFH 31398]MCH1865085.1 SRPBCC family protein [Nocardioides sp. CFH 31398]